jgi:hypothetical protein
MAPRRGHWQSLPPRIRQVDIPILWNVYAHELDAIETAVEAMMAEGNEGK